VLRLLRYNNVFVCFDSDAAGIFASIKLRHAISIIDPDINVYNIELDKHDPGEMNTKEIESLAADVQSVVQKVK
jgi:DNA primase